MREKDRQTETVNPVLVCLGALKYLLLFVLERMWLMSSFLLKQTNKPLGQGVGSIPSWKEAVQTSVAVSTVLIPEPFAFDSVGSWKASYRKGSAKGFVAVIAH